MDTLWVAYDVVFPSRYWAFIIILCTVSRVGIFGELRGFCQARISSFFRGDVQFVDVMVGDALTSMSKLLANMEVGNASWYQAGGFSARVQVCGRCFLWLCRSWVFSGFLLGGR